MNKTTSTMYHVGFSEITDEIVTHVFRSERDFELETLNHDTYWRPEDPGIEIDPEWELGPKVHALMVAMQEQQSGIPPRERIHIAGEATVLVLDRTGASIFSAGTL